MRPDGLIELSDYPDYGVTADGQVWSLKSGAWRSLALTNNGSGYMKVKVIHRSGEVITRKVHCLVAAAFLGDRPDAMDINHKDGNKAHNAVTNLEYITRQANVLHSIHVLGHKPGRPPHSAPPRPEEIERRRRIARCHARRRLAAKCWLRDGRRSLSGSARASMKLTEQQVIEIRAYAAAAVHSKRAIARFFSVSHETVNRIVARTKWAHV